MPTDSSHKGIQSQDQMHKQTIDCLIATNTFGFSSNNGRWERSGKGTWCHNCSRLCVLPIVFTQENGFIKKGLGISGVSLVARLYVVWTHRNYLHIGFSMPPPPFLDCPKLCKFQLLYHLVGDCIFCFPETCCQVPSSKQPGWRETILVVWLSLHPPWYKLEWLILNDCIDIIGSMPINWVYVCFLVIFFVPLQRFPLLLLVILDQL